MSKIKLIARVHKNGTFKGDITVVYADVNKFGKMCFSNCGHGEYAESFYLDGTKPADKKQTKIARELIEHRFEKDEYEMVLKRSY